MRRRTAVGAVALLGMLSSSPVRVLGQSGQELDDAKELICGKGNFVPTVAEAPPPTPEAVKMRHDDSKDASFKTPRLTLSADGTLEIQTPELASLFGDSGLARALSYRFTPSAQSQTDRVVMRVDRISPRGTEMLRCGDVSPAKNYFYDVPADNTGALRSHDILVFSLYARRDSGWEQITSSRGATLDKELSGAAASSVLHGLKDGLAEEVSQALAGTGGPIMPADLEAPIQAAAFKWGCEVVRGSEPMLWAPKTRFKESSKAICGALTKFRDALAANPPKYSDMLAAMGEKASDSKALCKKVAQHRYVVNGTYLPLARFEVPFGPASDIHEALFDSGHSKQASWNSETKPLLLLTHVPREQGAIHLNPAFVDAPRSDAGVTLFKFMAAAAQSYLLGKDAASVLKSTATNASSAIGDAKSAADSSDGQKDAMGAALDSVLAEAERATVRARTWLLIAGGLQGPVVGKVELDLTSLKDRAKALETDLKAPGTDPSAAAAALDAATAVLDSSVEKLAEAVNDMPFACGSEAVVDPGLPTKAQVGTRAGRVPEALGQRKLTLQVCAGEKCEEKKDDKPGNIANTIVFEPERAWGPVLMAGIGLSGMPAAPQFQAIGGSSGPDQVYELTQDDIDIEPSVDLLLGLPVCHRRFIWFLGPALLSDDYKIAHLWKAGAGVRLGGLSKYIYLLGHFSLGARDAYDDAKVGKRWIVPIDKGTPKVVERSRLFWGFGLTVGFDVDMVGAGVDEFLKAVGGGGES